MNILLENLTKRWQVENDGKQSILTEINNESENENNMCVVVKPNTSIISFYEQIDLISRSSLKYHFCYKELTEAKPSFFDLTKDGKEKRIC